MTIAVDGDAAVEPSGEILDQWKDELVPASVEPLANHRYSAPYAWMYSYEKQLKRRLETTLRRPLRASERLLFGADGVVSESLSNAFVHGHARDATRPILVSCAVSESALWVSVEDDGPGFDVQALVARMRGGGAFYHIAGNGLRALEAAPAVTAAYDRGGTRVRMRIDLHHPGKG